MSTAGDRKGLVLIGVLWLVVVLAVIAVVTGRKSRLDTMVRTSSQGQVRCRWACRAGLETALGVLNEDLRASDCLTDSWSENELDFNDVELKGCFYTVKVVDEASKLNVNTAKREQLLGLQDMTEEIADAIIDWRDKDDNMSGGGAEAGYYQNLAYGYQIRNGPFRTMRELLLVRGVMEQLLYGEDTNLNGKLDYNERDGDVSGPPDDGNNQLDRGWITYLTCYSYDRNVDADGNQRVNINKANEEKIEKSLNISPSQAKWIVENRKDKGYESIADLIDNESPKKPSKDSKENKDEAEPLDLKTFSQIADKITVKDEEEIPGRVNVNTAPRTVLAALLGGDESAERTADEIISYRKGLLDGMRGIAELLEISSINIKTFKKIADSVTTRSDVYAVRCFGTTTRTAIGGASLQTEAVVNRSERPCKIVYWYQGPTAQLAGYGQIETEGAK